MKTATPHEMKRAEQWRKAEESVGINTVAVMQAIEKKLNDVPFGAVCHRCKAGQRRTSSTIKAAINWFRRCPFCHGRLLCAIPMNELFSERFLMLGERFRVTRR